MAEGVSEEILDLLSVDTCHYFYILKKINELLDLNLGLHAFVVEGWGLPYLMDHVDVLADTECFL